MKNIIKISITIIAITSIFSFNKVNAQSNILYGMGNIPQTVNTNPAHQPNCSFYLGFPALSNIYANLNNSSLTLNTIFEPKPTVPDSFFIDINEIEKQIKPMNYLNIEENISLIDFGFRIANGFYFTFTISNKTTENFGFSNSLIDLPKGNFNEAGLPVSIKFYQNLTNYNEYSASLSKQLMNNLTVGAKIKLLSGNANLKASKLNLDWYTESATDSLYEWTFNTDIEVKGSAIVDWDIDYVDNKYVFTYGDIKDLTADIPSLLFSPNTGLAFDFGAEYTLFNKLKLSASIIDLGYIKWQTNSKVLTQNGSFKFSGVDLENYITSISDIMNGANISDQIIQDLKDSVLTFLEPTISEASYKTSLNTKVYIGANYFLTKKIDAGFLFRGTMLNSSLYSSYTFSVNTNFGKGWAFSADYSIMYGLYNNIGLGLAYKIGPLQMYILTDNISPFFWAVNESKLTDNLIRNTKGTSIQFGMNFVAFKQKIDYGLIE